MGLRECPFCGQRISDSFRDCPHCHETLPEIPRAGGARVYAQKKRTIRRGLLYMMVVAVIYYLFSPSSPLKLPVPFAPVLTTYLLPLFFIAGLAMVLYGIFQHVRE
jgi:hypothetical protein